MKRTAVALLFAISACSTAPAATPAQNLSVGALAGMCTSIRLSRLTTPAEDAQIEACEAYVGAFEREHPTACHQQPVYLIDAFLMWAGMHPERADAPADEGLAAAAERVRC